MKVMATGGPDEMQGAGNGVINLPFLYGRMYEYK